MTRMILLRVVLPVAILFALLVACGRLLTHLRGLAAVEDGINRDLAAHRTADLSAATDVLSRFADTATVIALVLLSALVLRWALHRWSEAVTLVSAVFLQAGVFLLTSMVIDRRRPAVPHLDDAPPTSSFPSGHTGAAVALYGGLALIVAWRMRHLVPKAVLVTVLVSVPFLVASARLYRGMHHPTDVLFGAANGLACLTIAVRAFRPAARKSEAGSRALR